jgi:sulfur carrier protein
MRIVLNGRPTEVPVGTLAELLVHQQAAGPGIAAAVNDEVVPRAAHAERLLRPGDVVEIVSAVQGG